MTVLYVPFQLYLHNFRVQITVCSMPVALRSKTWVWRSLAMLRKFGEAFVIMRNLKVPKIKKILLYEMKFLVPNYSCLQNPWLGGYRPQIPVLSVLCPQLNLLNPPTPSRPPNTIPAYATGGQHLRERIKSLHLSGYFVRPAILSTAIRGTPLACRRPKHCLYWI